MSVTDHDDMEENMMYYDVLHQERKSQGNSLVIREFNSIIGEGSTNELTGL